jgi:RNase P/RNase MRP subunit POP5
MRTKHRYLAFRVSGPRSFTASEITESLVSAIRELYGNDGLSRIKPKLIKFSPEEQRGILRCVHLHLSETRTAFALLDRISGSKVAIHVERVSGTIKSLCESKIHNFS